MRHWASTISFLTDRPKLNHFLLVLHICVSESSHHWFRWWFVAYSAPSQYLNQCFVIVNWTLSNKLQWNFNPNPNNFIHKNTFENVVCEMAVISSRGDELMLSWCHVSSLTRREIKVQAIDAGPHRYNRDDRPYPGTHSCLKLRIRCLLKICNHQYHCSHASQWL